jgi:hypothetical protein
VKDDKKAIAAFLGFVTMAVVIPLDAFTTFNFWNWFIAPICHLSAIGWAGAFGLEAFVLLYYRMDLSSEKHDDPLDHEISLLGNRITKYGLAWATAGLIHLAVR